MNPDPVLPPHLDDSMTLILDGNSEHVAHAKKENRSFVKKKILFVTVLDLIKCFKQIK